MYQVKQPFTFSQETNPTQTGEKVDVALKKYMEEQRLITKNLYEKLDHMFGDLSSKFGSLSTHVQKLEVQIAQTAEAAKKQNEVNTQTFCSVVSSIDGTIVPTLSQREEEENEPKERHKPERYSWESRRAYKRRLEGKPLQKQEDPGKFVITSSINGIQLHDCLCDTGANVNLMSLALAKDLGFKEFKSPKIRVEFADLSFMEPYGMLEDVMMEVGGRSVPTDFQIIIWEGSKRNQLILGTPFLATAGAVLNYFGNHLSFGHIRQDIFFPSVNFRQVPSATKLPPEEAPLTPKKEAVMHGGRREGERYPKPKEKKKTLESRHENVFKDINSISLPTFDEYGAEEETNGAPNLFHKIRIFTPKDLELKGDQYIEEKLERTMKLFPKALVFKDDVRDDYGVTKPLQEATEPENGVAKGILCPSATLHHD
ncbi:unnamed protein product [Microthlaspi erraticum]|uniref:Aspartic peptidase DDI1-type domain-containing protein n=1 Tax=Microthlaspi erraticum TaxID=1685480 RepID=A0A6D2I8H3_9BRAS|nr:unnamed protein product [Microthlaspi erraticum]